MLFLAVPALAAQKLLPAHFGGWQAVAGGASEGIGSQASPGDEALFRDCQQQSMETQVYQRGNETITVTLRVLGDPTYAYSAFSVLRPVPVTDFRPTPHSAIGNDQAMMLIGNLLVNVTGQKLRGDAKDFSALAAALKPHASTDPYPTLWQYLPTENLIPHSDRYALDAQTFQRALEEIGSPDWAAEGWAGFKEASAEAEMAQYKVAGKPETLILLSYPTPQLASQHIQDLRQWFDVNPTGKAAGGKPVIYAKRIGMLAGIVAGAKDQAAADELLGQIRYQTEITWNAPGFKLHELTMGDYVVGSIMGTFFILMIALVVGIALGMVRIGVKHYLPGVVFDRRRSVEIIQLGLSSKPIDARDFY